jgi:hypothetical protein
MTFDTFSEFCVTREPLQKQLRQFYGFRALARIFIFGNFDTYGDALRYVFDNISRVTRYLSNLYDTYGTWFQLICVLIAQP